MRSHSATSAQQGTRKIIIVAYNGVKLMDVAGPLQAFTDARFADGCPAYRVIVASELGGLVTSDTGIKLETAKLNRALVNSVDTLLVSGSDLTVPPVATDSLRARVAQFVDRPRRLGSICTGAFILAKLGVLDGHEVTTHWAFCGRFKREYPNVKVNSDALFVTSGRIWTSAGVSAGIDMALAMIEEDMDHQAALKVARGMVLFLKRPGGQSQFSVELQRQMHDERGRFDDLHKWIRANLAADLSVPALAAEARMSARNFARVYLRDTGESPAQAVEKIRIEAAIRLLESAREPIKVIASRTGFGDDERMRRAFVKTYGVSPQDYRGRFGRSSTRTVATARGL
jgi:transcriptional regulator GlxA family with amidase domain